mgnify:CR=1 FL=1
MQFIEYALILLSQTVKYIDDVVTNFIIEQIINLTTFYNNSQS